MGEKKIKVLIAKPGLDGHDRGAKIVSLALKDAGMDVVYTGLHKTVEDIVKEAKKESVDVIGLSIMSGAHIPICNTLFQLLKKEGMEKLKVFVGGVIPKGDINPLTGMGVCGVYPGGTPFENIVSGIKGCMEKSQGGE